MEITGYRFGRIEVDGRAYHKDVLLLPPRVLSPWWRRQGHSLVLADLDEVLAYAPQVLVVGRGASGALTVPAETQRSLAAAGIEVEALLTEPACARFGELLGQGRRVAAGLHLTC